MIDKPTIAEERLARLIAFWHGQRIVFFREGRAMTVAGSREYVDAARAVMEAR
jgi:hypothetical protein